MYPDVKFDQFVMEFLNKETNIHEYLEFLEDKFKKVLAFLGKRIANREVSTLMMEDIVKFKKDSWQRKLAEDTFSEHHPKDGLESEYMVRLAKLRNLIRQWVKLLGLMRPSLKNARRFEALIKGLEPLEKTKSHLVKSVFVNNRSTIQELMKINEGLAEVLHSSKLTAPTSPLLSFGKTDLESDEKVLKEAIKSQVRLAAEEEKNRLTGEATESERLERDAHKMFYLHYGEDFVKARKKDLRKEIDRLYFLKSFYVDFLLKF